MHNIIDAMSGNPLLLVNNWQGLGSGNHAQYAQRHDDWIKELSIEFLKLRSEMDAIRLENIQLKRTCDDLSKELGKQSTRAPSFAEMASAKTGGSTAAMRAIVRDVKNEIKIENKIDKNVIVSGLTESESSDEVVKEEHDNNTVEKLLATLGVGKEKMASHKRLNKRNPTEQTISTATKQSPPPILIEFYDR